MPGAWDTGKMWAVPSCTGGSVCPVAEVTGPLEGTKARRNRETYVPDYSVWEGVYVVCRRDMGNGWEKRSGCGIGSRGNENWKLKSV